MERDISCMEYFEHMRTKSMWAGNKSIVETKYHTISGNKIKNEELSYSPALFKLFDEVLVNALDHHTHYPKLVTSIEVTFDGKSICVKNNGPGISLKKIKVNNNEIYAPTAIITVQFSGDNTKVKEVSYKGGTNGIGLKIVTAFSKSIKLQTVSNSVMFTQEVLNGGSEILEPELIPTSSLPFTSVTYLPNYEEYFKFTAEDCADVMNKLYFIRCHQAKIYTEINITYNGIVVNTENLQDYINKRFKKSLIFYK